MRLRKEKAIVTIYDAVSILKGFNVVNGSLTQNYYAESATYVPNRYIIPLVLRPKIDVSDPNNVIENGDKVDELARLEWFYNGDKINSNDDFKIEGANLTIFKNSEEPFEISYKAEWFDSRKKQSITIEDTILVSCMSLAQSEFNARLSLDKPQNWLHNPLKNERIYKIRAYVSKDKVYDGAVAWYYVDNNKKDKLIDETCNFYVGGQNTNELSIDSSYLDSIIIKAKNIDNEKLKEIYWFFDKEGNPITYSEPEKTIIEGKDVFNLPESPITSKLDYRIEGLTVQNLIKNGDFSDGNKYWSAPNQNIKSVENNILTTTVKELSPYMRLETNEPELEKIIIGSKVYCRLYVKAKVDVGKLQVGGSNFTASSIKEGHLSLTSGITETTDSSNFFRYYHSSSSGYEIGDELQYSNIMIVDLTQTFGAGNEPSKEWCDEHIQGYFEGIKSVQTPLRIKSEIGRINLLYDSSKIIDVDQTTDYQLGAYRFTEDILPDTDYTFTFQVEVFESFEARIWFSCGYFSENYIDKTPDLATGRNEVVTYSLTFNTKIKENPSFFMRLYNYGYQSSEENRLKNKFTILKAKLEKGDKSTPWTPAPEDNAPATGGTMYINNNIELKSVGTVSDYIENGKLYKNTFDLDDVEKHWSLRLIKDEVRIFSRPVTQGFKVTYDSMDMLANNIKVNNTVINLNNATNVGLTPHNLGKVIYFTTTDKTLIPEQYFKDNDTTITLKSLTPEIINLNTSGSLQSYPNGTIFIEPATLVEQQYNDGLQVDLPIKTLESIKVGTEYLDTSKAVVKDNLITHPDIANGDNVIIEYIYDENPIRNTNSIAYLVLEDILDEFWLDNVYTYKITNGEWELVKVTDIEDYEEWLKTEKTSPYTLAPDGVIFGSYEAETKFIRQYPSSLYVDIIAPTRLKQGITKIKARVLVGTRDGVVENPSNYFHFVWYRKENQAGAVETIIGHGEEIEIDIKEKDMIGVELQSLGVLSDTKTGDDRTLTDDENRKITLR